ncbi:hypothetical protein K2X30_04675 [bacterium]|nr:hypothetical protein [bacterium]
MKAQKAAHNMTMTSSVLGLGLILAAMSAALIAPQMAYASDPRIAPLPSGFNPLKYSYKICDSAYNDKKQSSLKTQCRERVHDENIQYFNAYSVALDICNGRYVHSNARFKPVPAKCLTVATKLIKNGHFEQEINKCSTKVKQRNYTQYISDPRCMRGKFDVYAELTSQNIMSRYEDRLYDNILGETKKKNIGRLQKQVRRKKVKTHEMIIETNHNPAPTDDDAEDAIIKITDDHAESTTLAANRNLANTKGKAGTAGEPIFQAPISFESE